MNQQRCSLTRVVLCLLLLLPGMGVGQELLPVLEFPQPDLDDTVAYRGYMTRFFRDSDGNTVQVVLNQNDGRVINLWADAADESISLSLRDPSGTSPRFQWLSAGAVPARQGNRRSIQYTLAVGSPNVKVGLFLLGSMRKERDFQYQHMQQLPLDTAPVVEQELAELLANIERLPASEQAIHLSLLHAKSPDDLRSRLRPTITASDENGRWVVNVSQMTFDGENVLTLQLSGETSKSRATLAGTTVEIHSFNGTPVRLAVKIGTDSPSLTPLSRNQIFKKEFFRYVDSIRLGQRSGTEGGLRRGQSSLNRYRLVERQITSVELLSSKEKFMAGLPNYATYFGRDMMMSAMMMESILQPAVLEHVIESVLRKLAPDGRVSHEEALGGQAIRENAGEYNHLVDGSFQMRDAGDSHGADSMLAQSRAVLATLQRVRENYMMVDESFQLPVLVARYLSSDAVTGKDKRSFLLGKMNGTPRLEPIMRNLVLVQRQTAPFTARHEATSLVSFPRLDGGRWMSGSWRDSGPGYANGRFGMDINVIWVPKALEAIRTILSALRLQGIIYTMLDSLAPEIQGTVLHEYMQNPSLLDDHIAKWRSAKEFFRTTISGETARQRIDAKLSSLTEGERRHWSGVLNGTKDMNQGIAFLALALDSLGKAIPVVNTDPATLLFLDDFIANLVRGAATTAEVEEIVHPFVVPYPLGLYVAGVGPLVANDAYASREVWEAFEYDQYHSPRAVWGREVNLFMLGVCKQLVAAEHVTSGPAEARVSALAHSLRDALYTVRTAVEASGLQHSELWSYVIEGGTAVSARYPASCDIQLWNLTDLAVQFELDHLPR